jgi:hypothetical protein
MRIVLLWFGAIKNAKSTYAPTWVLADRDRFRARKHACPWRSPRGAAAQRVRRGYQTADARAFAELLDYLARTMPNIPSSPSGRK